MFEMTANVFWIVSVVFLFGYLQDRREIFVLKRPVIRNLLFLDLRET